ncbi:MAG: hypothetical protein JKX88_06535 [Marinicaulis sp.]|nr:hypothetical protein [Marinicaulis sp.]
MITTSNQIAAENSAITVQTKKESQAATSASDFESFLKLLTAQLKNQDPLSPLDSTQFVAQLASFSSVEQQVATNTKLDALVAGLVGSNLENATRWIGKEVEISSGATRFEGDALEFRIPDSGIPDAVVEISISAANGNAIYSEKLGVGTSTFTWNGKTATGGTAVNGDYKVSINYITDGEVAETKAPIVAARVTEARLIDTSVKLLLENGAFVDPAEVLAVREASNPALDS